MDVAVTGGTGYVGAFTVRALQDAGHRCRVLVRSPERLQRNAGSVGVDLDALDVVEGDMADENAVRRLVTGADAAIHAAAVVAALDRSDAERTVTVNVEGTRTVVDAALDAGCDPVVHVSSVAALFDPSQRILTVDLPPAVDAASPYTRSKALADALVRERQAAGAPAVLVYPGGVTGPAAGEAYGEVAQGFVSMLRTGFLALDDGAIGIIDVRDLAAVMAAAVDAGRGPRRYLVGGRLTTLSEIGAHIRSLTGRRFPVLPTPGGVLRGLGRVTDVVRRVVPFETVFTEEAMSLLTLARDTDDSAVHDDLGVDYRDVAGTIEASLRALHDGGLLSARQVGRLASA